jgi:pyruvate dehydrogenase phosphatase
MTFRPPKSCKTPPYVTATPVVTHRKIFIPPLHRSESRASDSEPTPVLRFIVLATDGLWEQLSSEDVVSLVAGHHTGLKGVISKSTLPTLVPTSVGTPGVEGKRKTRRPADAGSWAFVDDNVGAHLVRNAFGGGDEERLRKLLSVSAPNSRRMRDDVTVTVLWWEEGVDEAVKYRTFNTRDRNAK